MSTQGEGRARKDEEAIAKLFPVSTIDGGVTDLAWPHVAGVRYWVRTALQSSRISGARIPAKCRGSSLDPCPDYWSKRKTASLKFIGMMPDYSTAGGAISLHRLMHRQRSSLMGYFVADRFLWPQTI